MRLRIPAVARERAQWVECMVYIRKDKLLPPRGPPNTTRSNTRALFHELDMNNRGRSQKKEGWGCNVVALPKIKFRAQVHRTHALLLSSTSSTESLLLLHA